MTDVACIEVAPEFAGMRLDAFMAAEGLYPTRSAAAKCIAEGCAALNGRIARKSATVSAGDVLEYETFDDPHAPVLDAVEIPLDVRYEDDYLLVISKQAGLVCHPADGHYGDTLVNALIAHCGRENLCDVQGEQDRLGIVHRLDKDTSGLMLCAKTNEVGLALMEDIRTRDVDRHYLALVQGWIPLETGLVDAPIARGERDRLRMKVSDRDNARPSITTFRPLTDNDRGAGHAFERAAWAVAGKYARCVDCAIANRGENAVEATYTYELAIPQRTKVTVRYVADTAGLVSLDVEYPGEKNGDLPTIPAFGIEWALPVEYANLRFYGAGPEETYADRRHAKLGVWSTTAGDDCAPYLLPQETGNHEDVRWAEITDDSGHGVRVKRGAGAKPFAMSLLPYSSTMLEEALHQDELPKPRHMFLRLLAAQMGVGGDDSWMSPVHEQYQLPADQPLSLNVQLKLF